MSDLESFDQEPSENSSEKASVSIKTRKSFAKLRRELSDEELSSPAVQRLLLDEIERMDRQVLELESYRKGYYEIGKRNAVLEQKGKRSVASEIIFGVSLCVGAAAMGYAPSLWSHQPTGYLSMVFGAILIIGGTLAKLVQR